jgi:hypothetical protein
MEDKGERPNQTKMGRRKFLGFLGQAAAGAAVAVASIPGSNPPEKVPEQASGEAADKAAIAAWKNQLKKLHQEGKIDLQGKIDPSLVSETLQYINEKFPTLEDKEGAYHSAVDQRSTLPEGSRVINNESVGAIVDSFLLGVALENQRQGQTADPRNIEMYTYREKIVPRIVELTHNVGTPEQVTVIKRPNEPRRTLITLEFFRPSPDTGTAIFGHAIDAGIKSVDQESMPLG